MVPKLISQWTKKDLRESTMFSVLNVYISVLYIVL